MNEYLERRSAVVNAINSHGCVFLTGGAGSGKSYMLKDIASLYENTIKLAPTGLAAVNIGGSTIHKFLSLPPNLFRPRDVAMGKRYDKKFIELLDAADLIILDEVSMCSALILDAMDETFKTVMRDDRPFGGKKVLLCGDLAQLPPVVKNEERRIIFSELGYDEISPSSSYVFNELRTIELLGSYRQKEDEDFAEMLNCIRMIRIGRYEGESYSLNKQIQKLNKGCLKSSASLDHEARTSLVYTNKAASNLNNFMISQVKGGNGVTYLGKEEGTVS